MISLKDYVEENSNNCIISKDGSKLISDDGVKNEIQKNRLEYLDLKNMFITKYRKMTEIHPTYKL